MKPFLKWAGNKYRIIEKINDILPEGNRLVEPFTGSAAVFLNTSYRHSLLAESNHDLINLYKLLQTQGDNFIDDCKKLFTVKNNTEKRYYHLREVFNTTKDINLKAQLFIYLNRHGYNGLCRYNSKGVFNVPYGRYEKPYFPAKEMQHFQQKSQSANIVLADFQQTLNNTRTGDVIYCDPPYIPLTSTANFTQYNPNSFSIEQQEVLAQSAEQLATKGLTVVISNHDTPYTRKLYKKAKLHRFMVQRNISCTGNMRTKVPELLAIFNAK